ncbi:MAG: hypothetical protein ACYTBS_24340 [Planctomycetota bacterium]
MALALGLAAEVANADFIFGEPTNLGPTVNSSSHDSGVEISADGLSLLFNCQRGGSYGGEDIWVTTRATKAEPWGTPVNLGPAFVINSWSHDLSPDVSADGLMLYFVSDRPGGYGNYDLWVAMRYTTHDQWGGPVNLGPTVNSSGSDRGPSISADGLSLFFDSERSGGSGGQDILVTTRETTDDDWGVPVNLGPIVNSPIDEYNPDISADGLWLFFSSERPGGYGGSDLWVTTRETIHDPWGVPVNLGPTVNNSAGDSASSISADGSILYFSSRRPGGLGSGDIYQVPVVPVVDFNGDERIDFKDFSLLALYWLQDESLVDIAPPLGDNMVDCKDIVVFAEHWPEVAWQSVVDDFEEYDAYNPIWENWRDGLAFGDAQGVSHPGNGTGSEVGDANTASFTEETIVHGGSQSMPFAYDNTGSGGKACYSQAERTWDVAEDWIRYGVKELKLWFHGDPGNAAEQLYMAVEDSAGKIKVVNYRNPNALLLGTWREWKIDMKEFSDAGVNLRAVKKMYIGLGDRADPKPGGTGIFYVDDISLYRAG